MRKFDAASAKGILVAAAGLRSQLAAVSFHKRTADRTADRLWGDNRSIRRLDRALLVIRMLNELGVTLEILKRVNGLQPA